MARRLFPFLTFLVLALSFVPVAAASAPAPDSVILLPPPRYFEPQLKKTTYIERLITDFGVYAVGQGDDNATEDLKKDIKTMRYTPFIVYEIHQQARTLSKGPTALAQHTTFGNAFPGGTTFQYVHKGAWTIIEAEIIVYNKNGTETPMEVPIRAKGRYKCRAWSQPPALPSGGSNTAYADAEIRLSWTAPNGSIVSGIAGEQAKSNGEDEDIKEREFTVGVPVFVGAAPLAHEKFTLRLESITQGVVVVGSDVLGNLVIPWGTSQGYAEIDPVVYIDPQWPHASQFGLVFKDDVGLGKGYIAPILPLLLGE